MKISRRSFLSGSLIAGAGVFTAGFMGCSPIESSEENTSSVKEKTQETITHTPSKTEQYDIVVVGSGTAGTVAALRAAQKGASVLCLEKNSSLGGTSVFAEGLCGINSNFQKNQDITVDASSVFADTMNYHHYACLGPVVNMFINNCGETIDWLEDEGVVFSTVVALGDSYPVWHLPADEKGAPTSIKIILDILQDKAKALGVEFRTEAPMTDLATKENAVTGVYIESKQEEVLIEAQSVILATGGYANNADLFEKFTGRPYNKVHVWGMVGRDGDGISSALRSVNADTHIPSTVMYHTGKVEGTDAFSDIPNFVLTMQPTLRINKSGKRYFNEAVTSDFSATGNVLTTNAGNYVFFDDAYIDHIETEGPFFPMPNLGAFVGQPFSCREEIENCIGVIKADTIEELANKLGLNTLILQESIDRYNNFCKSGTDEDFGKPATMLLAVEKKPFYAAKITPTLFTTVGGLCTDESLQVINTDGALIKGLYAVGSDASGLYGANYDVDVCSGSQQGWAATSGRIAAEHATSSF